MDNVSLAKLAWVVFILVFTVSGVISLIGIIITEIIRAMEDE